MCKVRLKNPTHFAYGERHSQEFHGYFTPCTCNVGDHHLIIEKPHLKLLCVDKEEFEIIEYLYAMILTIKHRRIMDQQRSADQLLDLIRAFFLVL